MRVSLYIFTEEIIWSAGGNTECIEFIASQFNSQQSMVVKCHLNKNQDYLPITFIVVRRYLAFNVIIFILNYNIKTTDLKSLMERQ
jgi:hypothetical protein